MIKKLSKNIVMGSVFAFVLAAASFAATEENNAVTPETATVTEGERSFKFEHHGDEPKRFHPDAHSHGARPEFKNHNAHNWNVPNSDVPKGAAPVPHGAVPHNVTPHKKLPHAGVPHKGMSFRDVPHARSKKCTPKGCRSAPNFPAPHGVNR